jgi:hypothetical protein
MNRKSIATVSADAAGDYWWTPTPKIAALGLRPVRLGTASEPFNPDQLGNYADGNDELRATIVNLNGNARMLAKQRKIATKQQKRAPFSEGCA